MRRIYALAGVLCMGFALVSVQGGVSERALAPGVKSHVAPLWDWNHPAVGSWMGRAVPLAPFCPPGSEGCPVPAELWMTPTILPGGHFLGNDSLTFGAPHTTAHGQWWITGRAA